MNKKVNIFLGITISIMALVSVLVCFAPMFNNAEANQIIGGNYAGSEIGNVFQVMFYGYATKGVLGYSSIPLFIVAFIAECLAFLLGFVCAGFDGKKSLILFAVTGLLLVFSGTIFLIGKSLYMARNTLYQAEGMQLGAGAICTVVFSWIGGVVSLYGAYRAAKN